MMVIDMMMMKMKMIMVMMVTGMMVMPQAQTQTSTPSAAKARQPESHKLIIGDHHIHNCHQRHRIFQCSLFLDTSTCPLEVPDKYDLIWVADDICISGNWIAQWDTQYKAWFYYNIKTGDNGSTHSHQTALALINTFPSHLHMDQAS